MVYYLLMYYCNFIKSNYLNEKLTSFFGCKHLRGSFSEQFIYKFYFIDICITYYEKLNNSYCVYVSMCMNIHLIL